MKEFLRLPCTDLSMWILEFNSNFGIYPTSFEGSAWPWAKVTICCQPLLPLTRQLKRAQKLLGQKITITMCALLFLYDKQKSVKRPRFQYMLRDWCSWKENTYIPMSLVQASHTPLNRLPVVKTTALSSLADTSGNFSTHIQKERWLQCCCWCEL